MVACGALGAMVGYGFGGGMGQGRSLLRSCGYMHLLMPTTAGFSAMWVGGLMW